MPATGQAEAAAERRQKALDLRMAGARYRQIGAQLGVSYQTAYRDVQAALGELAPLQASKAEKLRELEVERCDKLTLALWPKARNGDEKAVRTIVAVMDRRAKLLGLDAPTKLEHGGSDGAPLSFTLNFTKPRADFFVQGQ
jgi:Homeodomain-like domain-containing protein